MIARDNGYKCKLMLCGNEATGGFLCVCVYFFDE